MSAEWCNNTEPHGEHYEPMPPGYSDEARVCFGITVCSRCGEPLHGRTSLCPCFASPMSEQTDPLAQLATEVRSAHRIGAWQMECSCGAKNPDGSRRPEWAQEHTGKAAADAIRAAVLADPTIVGMERLEHVAFRDPLYRTPEVKG